MDHDDPEQLCLMFSPKLWTAPTTGLWSFAPGREPELVDQESDYQPEG